MKWIRALAFLYAAVVMVELHRIEVRLEQAYIQGIELRGQIQQAEVIVAGLAAPHNSRNTPVVNLGRQAATRLL
jgi:hypothetical protein